MSLEEGHDERVTGQEATLKWGDSEIPITNVSWSRDVDTSEVQHNDTLNPKILVTGLSYSGSFEYTGRQWDVMNDLVYQEESGVHSRGEPQRGTLTVKETKEDNGDIINFLYTFKGVIVTSQSRDLPADDSASSSWDFSAEDMHVSKTMDLSE